MFSKCFVYKGHPNKWQGNSWHLPWKMPQMTRDTYMVMGSAYLKIWEKLLPILYSIENRK